LKGEYIKSVAFALTMGPGIKISHQTLAWCF
jgi:ribosomal protein L1